MMTGSINPGAKYVQTLVINFCILVVGVLLACFCATQYIAIQMDFSSFLGDPLFWYIYNPISFLKWVFTLNDFQSGYTLHFGVLIFISLLLGTIFLIRTLNIAARFKIEKSDAHGSARWATIDEIKQMGLLDKDNGVYVGAVQDKDRLRYLKDDSNTHVLLFSPSRSGKGVGFVFPTLIGGWNESVVVMDIKGENWAGTAAWRKEHLNNVCIKYNPLCANGTTAKYNPLLYVTHGTHEVTDVQNIVDILCDPHGRGKDDHWTLSANTLLLGVILHVLYGRVEKTLTEVVNVLSSSKSGEIYDVFHRMSKAKHDPDFERSWIDPLTKEPTQTHSVVLSVSREMITKTPEELSGIISTALTYLKIFKNPIVSENTSISDFCVEDLVNGDKPVSLYFSIPQNALEICRPLFRIIIKQILQRLTGEMKFVDGQSVSPHKHRLLFLMDEFASLGRLDTFHAAMSTMAGYGLKAFIIVQDMAQLIDIYGKNETFTSNARIHIAFGPNKLETAEMIAKKLGPETVTRSTKNLSGKNTNAMLSNVSEGMHDSGRSLMMTDELLRMGEDDIIVFVGRHRPVWGKRIKYYNNPKFAEAVKTPELEKSDKLDVNILNLGFPLENAVIDSDEEDQKKNTKKEDKELPEMELIEEDEENITNDENEFA